MKTFTVTSLFRHVSAKTCQNQNLYAAVGKIREVLRRQKVGVEQN